ncbi:heat shock 70 kDa protein 12A-like [Mytilus edulis]|uniref:heat shock 70 kDa protein 12A-like n=1 Tax=Mytilus edulis TaxID=6550 RepID=UPI0039EE9F61
MADSTIQNRVAKCEGGTTDIIVHEVKGPDTLQEIHHPFGGCYGGNTVNEQFVSFLDKIFGEDVVQHIRKNYPSEYFDLLSEFENKKTSFSGENSDDISVRLPLKWLTCFQEKTERSISEEVKKPTLKNKVSVRNDKMRIKHDVFLSFFEYSIKKVLEILEKLLKKPHIRNIDLLLAVGGYCESMFLINAIRQRFPKLNVIQPKDPSLAVLKGAVLYGFKSHTVSRLASHYC